MQNTVKVSIAQLNFMLGDIQANTAKIIQAAKHARDVEHADVIVFPELAISGYPPEDLLLRPHFHRLVASALDEILMQMDGIRIVVGHSHVTGAGIFNAASVLYNHEIIAHYRKQHLPNYSVFDEKRYFLPGDMPAYFDINETRFALTICEDLWQQGPLTQAKDAHADIVLCLNASPFHSHKAKQRFENLQYRQQQEGALPIVYVNCVGGQDELVFDGGSMVVGANGNMLYHANYFQEQQDTITIVDNEPLASDCAQVPPLNTRVYDALVLGTRDYCHKNNFQGALIGLSGGIDSALTLTVAVDALGAENVHAVLMPSRYTSAMSIEDAVSQAEKLNVKHSTISIESSFQSFLGALADEFANLPADTTEENIQARCRGIILMALSNKTGKVVLTTGNKSETAVGYSTLYGDMAGGFNVLKDVPKTLVYALANYRNTISPAIPERVITRPPSAELRENQVDQDSLPPYDLLDRIIDLYVTENLSQEEIIADGIEASVVRKVVKMIDRNEYKRRQAPPGVRISKRAFGRDWRYPITSAYGRNT